MSKTRVLIYWAKSKYDSKRERAIVGCAHLPKVRSFAVPAAPSNAEKLRALLKLHTVQQLPLHPESASIARYRAYLVKP